jgi:hypothetical protein
LRRNITPATAASTDGHLSLSYVVRWHTKMVGS